jgi:hypothetical protein
LFCYLRGTMRFFNGRLLAPLLALACSVVSTSNNLTDAVTWDPYSLSIQGERAFI